MVEDNPPPYVLNEELAKSRITGQVPSPSSDCAPQTEGCRAEVHPSTMDPSALEPPPPYLPPSYSTVVPFQPYYPSSYTNNGVRPPEYNIGTVGYHNSTQQLYYPGQVLGSNGAQRSSFCVLNSGAPVLVQPYRQKSYVGHIALACFVTWFCGCVCGIVAFRLALRARSCTDPADSETPRRLARASIGMSIAGIAVGAIIIVIIVSFISMSWQNTQSTTTPPCLDFNAMGYTC